MMTEYRTQIVRDFAKWTALSALRSGAPIKSRAQIYPLLDGVKFGELLQTRPPIAGPEFDEWRETETLTICGRDRRVAVGWAAKLTNVYLKAVPPHHRWLWSRGQCSRLLTDRGRAIVAGGCHAIGPNRQESGVEKKASLSALRIPLVETDEAAGR